MLPRLATNFAEKNLAFYQRKVPRLAFDAVNAYITIFGSLTFAMAAVSPMGSIKYGDLEKEVQEDLGSYDAEKVISFYKGQ